MADVEKGTRPGVYCVPLRHIPPTNFTHVPNLEHGYHDQPPSQEVSQFGDSSGPLFSMYSKIAEKDDRTMVERWQKDADGVIIFVSPPVTYYAIARIYSKSIDRSTLCNRRHTPLVLVPGPEAKLTRCLCFLSQEHLPTAC